MKNFSLYSLGALAVVLAALIIALPSQNPIALQPQNNTVFEKATEMKNKPPVVMSTDEQNYKYLNNKIIALTKQLNTLREHAAKTGDEQKSAALYAQIEKLNHDNEALRTKNEELNAKMADQTKLVNQNAKGNYEEAISKLSDELAFYKSDNDALKLSVSEKEGVIKNLNALISTLSNQKQMDEFEHDSAARKLKKELETAKQKIAAGLKNNGDLSKENEILKQRVSELSKLEVLNQSMSKDQAKLNLQIVELQKELSVVQRSNEDLKNKSKASSSKLALDNKNLKAKIDEVNAQLLKLSGQKDYLKAQLDAKKDIEAQAEKAKSEMLKLKLEFEKERAANVKELSKISSENQAALDKLNAELVSQRAQVEQMSKKVHSMEEEKASISLKNKELSAELDSLKQKLKTHTKELAQASEQQKHLQDINKDYKEQIALMKKDKIALTSQINALNKEFLSYKNSNFDKSYKDYGVLKDELMRLTVSYDELKAKNLALKDELANAQMDGKALGEKNAELSEQIRALNSKSKPNEDEALRAKIAKLEAANEKLLKDLDEAGAKQLSKFNEQNVELESLRKQNAALNQQLNEASKKSSFAQVKKVAEISCDDLRVGATELGENCKLALREFLDNYNASYYYEITPIINNGGFKSLSRLKSSQMDPAEVQRLTRLANYGLSKDRVGTARDYIRQRVPNALVGISAQAELSDNKKGFILSVYK